MPGTVAGLALAASELPQPGLQRGAAGATWAAAAVVPVPVRSPAASSFFNLPDLVDKLKESEQGLAKLDDKLQGYIGKIPPAVAAVKDNFPGRIGDVSSALRKTSSDAKLIREKIESFDERVTEALEDALKFNALVRKQHVAPDNKLPDEMYEGSGAVVSQLSRAHNLAKQVLLKDSKRLMRLAKRTSLKFAQLPVDAALLLPTAQADAHAAAPDPRPECDGRRRRHGDQGPGRQLSHFL